MSGNRPMPTMVHLADFKCEDGRWNFYAYHRARVAAGLECHQCGHPVVSTEAGPLLCNECRVLQSQSSANEHSRRVRCPSCRSLLDPYQLYPGDMHSHLAFENIRITCPDCAEEFSVCVRRETHFQSPAIR